MLEHWTQTLRVGIASAGIGLIKTHGWRFGRPPVFAVQTTGLEPTGVEPFDTQQADAGLLRTALQAHAVAGLPAHLVVCDSLVRLFMAAPPRNAARMQDTRAVAEMRFGTLYDDELAQWHLQADWDARHPFLVCAIPRGLRDGLLDAALSARLRVVEMVPQFVAALNRWHRALLPQAWLGVVHGGGLTVGIAQSGRLVSVRTLRLAQMAALDAAGLSTLLAQEALRAGQAAPQHLQLCGMVPAHWLVPKGDGLRITQLGPAASGWQAPDRGSGSSATAPLQPGLALAATGMRA